MITAWELYWWTRLDAFGIGFGICSFLFVVSAIVLYVIDITNGCGDWGDWAVVDEDGKPRYKKEFSMKKQIEKAKNLVMAIAIVFVLVAFLMPSKKDVAMMWIVPQLATVENSELLQGEAADIYNMAKEALRESIGAE